jgi:hypothetical protein
MFHSLVAKVQKKRGFGGGQHCPGGTGDDEVSVTVDDRKEALATAIERAGRGRTNIKILGDGRIYLPEELAVVINADF